MKILSILTILLNLLFANPNEDTIQLGTHTFKVLKESYNEYRDKGITLMLYDKDADKNASPLFSFTLENKSGGCGEQSTQEGTYEINGTTLSLYSHWDRSGRAYDAPKGDRIQHYTIDKNGSITFLDGTLYIETEAKNYDKGSVIKYLYNAPTNENEKKILQQYIQNVEHRFKGSFVVGEEAEKLHKQVDTALMKKRKTRWK